MRDMLSMRNLLLVIAASMLCACSTPTPVDRSREEAVSALTMYLEESRERAAKASVPFDSLVTCQIGDGMYQPIELLATYQVLDAVGTGDTLEVRAVVTTVAEEDGSPRQYERFVATQRVKTDTATWRVAKHLGGWRVCEGPQFGAYGSDALTTWSPSGASYQSARQLADSIFRANPPRRRGV